MKTFSETQPKQEQETDRAPLKDALDKVIIITGYVKQDSAKYPDGVARINAYDPADPAKKLLKFWYTGKAVIHQLDNMKKSVGMMQIGLFDEGIKTKVTEVKAEKGKYLALADP
jgi:hypothetical protein